MNANSQRLRRIGGTVGLALGLCGAAPAAEPWGCGGPAVAGCWAGETYACGPPQIYFSEPLDLDGDQQADFVHVAFKNGMACRWTSEDGTPAGRQHTDYTEALFPVGGVEVYVLPFPQYIKGVRIPMWPQEPIEPEPALVGSPWEWHTSETAPYLNAYGLGHTARYTETFPCRHPKGVCREESQPGVLERGDIPEAVVGFRLPKADGWHLGWVHLRVRPLAVERPDGQFSKLAVLDWAVHPEPDTALRAGEHPRPALAARRDAAADAVVLSWHPHWTGWVLERQRTVAGAAWEPAPGVTNNAARLPAGDGPWFFRLRGP